MKRMFTDTHVQVESGNDLFDRGAPRQMVRRRFPGKGVVWFEKSAVAGEDMERVSDFDLAARLEAKYSVERDRAPASILEPSDF